jgi:leucyl aminopeptidase
MEFGVTSNPLAKQRTGCIVAGVFEGRRLSRAAAELDAASAQAVADMLGSGDLDGRLGRTLLLHKVAGLAGERVLLVGLGREDEFDESSYRKALACAMKVLRTTGASTATIGLEGLEGLEGLDGRTLAGRGVAWMIEQAVLAGRDALYRFDRLKSAPEAAPALKKLVFHVGGRPDADACTAAIDRGRAIAEGVALARDLGNLPGNLCTPSYLAQQAQELGRRHGLHVEILEQQDIERLGMGAFLAVARGSTQPPKLIVLEYRGGDSDARPIVLVGKGITFDAGGISIKPAAEMDEMKFDMCGAASVFGAMHAAALMKLQVNVVGIVPATENMPGGDAIKPGDVVTTMAGLTVEILDTDCEGRLVLCDALTYARKYEPGVVVDVATLTGEIVKALGSVASGLFTSDDALARELLDAGERAWDRAWRMPLWDEYQEALQSNFADLPNIGSQDDCSVTAACFLSRFTSAYPWAHLDVAGTAARSGADKGATGRPVPLLVHFLSQRANNGGKIAP